MEQSHRGRDKHELLVPSGMLEGSHSRLESDSLLYQSGNTNRRAVSFYYKYLKTNSLCCSPVWKLNEEEMTV